MSLHQTQEELLAWLVTSKRDRRIHGLPANEQEWAEWKGTTTRTMRRWKADEEFQELLSQRKLATARELTPNATVTPEDVGGARAVTDARARRRFEAPPEVGPEDDPLELEDLSPEERQYRKVKSALAAMAEQENHQAIDLWLKHYGKPFIEAEQQADSSLADLSDEGLADEVVRLLGVDRVAAAMARATDVA